MSRPPLSKKPSRDTRSVFFHKDEASTYSVDHRSCCPFVKQLHFLNAKSAAPIDVHFISVDGGDTDFGMAAFSAIKNSRSKITVYASGNTASMGTIILQAAHKRLLCASGSFMVHAGSIEMDDSATACKSYVEANEKFYKFVLTTYAERCQHGEFFAKGKYSLGKVKSYINTKIKNTTDWWMTPEEAVYYGFADQTY